MRDHWDGKDFHQHTSKSVKKPHTTKTTGGWRDDGSESRLRLFKHTQPISQSTTHNYEGLKVAEHGIRELVEAYRQHSLYSTPINQSINPKMRGKRDKRSDLQMVKAFNMSLTCTTCVLTMQSINHTQLRGQGFWGPGIRAIWGLPFPSCTQCVHRYVNTQNPSIDKLHKQSIYKYTSKYSSSYTINQRDKHTISQLTNIKIKQFSTQKQTQPSLFNISIIQPSRPTTPLIK